MIGLGIMVCIGSSALLCAQDEVTELHEAFLPVLGSTWYLSDTWQDGSEWYHSVSLSYEKDQDRIRSVSRTYADGRFLTVTKEQIGTRWLDQQGVIRFEEMVGDKSVAEGTVEFSDGGLAYHYEYEGQAMTDRWRYRGVDQCQLRVGVQGDEKWTSTYIDGIYVRREGAPSSDLPQDLPFASIPEAPADYTASTVAARMVDALGFRYHWATHDLREKDLDYKASASSRTVRETMEHILGLAEVVYNAAQRQPTGRSADKEELTHEQMRARTLDYLWKTSQILRAQDDKSLSEQTIIFQRGEVQSDPYPFWNVLNGPLADAMWHTGQVVAHRRASGNPLPTGVNVFSGTKR